MRRRLPKIIFLVALLLGAGCLALQRYPILKVQGVEVSGSERIDAAALGVAVGGNVFAFDTDALLDSIIARPFVESASVRFDLEGTLQVQVQEKMPVCYIYTDGPHGLSAACELLPPCDTLTSLPMIRGGAMKNVSDYDFVDDSNLHAAIKLLNLMKDRVPLLLEQISEILVRDQGLELVLEPGTAVVELGWGEYQRKLEMLELVLAGNRNPALRLDLRFGDIAILKASDSNRRSNHEL
ncbi:MAG: FtsQ-type POTRA domain-containing protein [bacterium]